MTQKPETKKPFNVISFAVRGEKGGRRPGLCVESEADWGGRMTGVAAGGFGDCIQHKQSSPVTGSLATTQTISLLRHTGRERNCRDVSQALRYPREIGSFDYWW